jgi:glycosyltransferase involved in cell wall biosynthesis
MRASLIVDAIIPALDEEDAIPGVLEGLKDTRVRHAIVVDNGSRDRTPEVARRHGAVVVTEPKRGYGAACLRGIALAASSAPRPDVLVFLDADGADDPSEIDRLIAPIGEGRADLVLGSRVMPGSRVEPGALTPQQRAGNLVATTLIHALYGVHQTDLGPYRAISWDGLARLEMQDLNWGWTVEMQVKAIRRGLKVLEVPTTWRRRRAGRSKVSGTVRGVIGAGYKILTTVLRHSL